jgi:hypothetical protein
MPELPPCQATYNRTRKPDAETSHRGIECIVDFAADAGM